MPWFILALVGALAFIYGLTRTVPDHPQLSAGAGKDDVEADGLFAGKPAPTGFEVG